MHFASRTRFERRGTAVVAMVVVMVIASLVIIGMVLGGAREQDLTIARMETVRALYAAEAGMNMALRELHLNSDEDGDGGIGTISDDGNAANDPLFGSARVSVTASTQGEITTLTSAGRQGSSERLLRVAASTQSSGGTAMIAYGKIAQSRPQYRIWNGSDWGDESAASNIGSSPQWLVLRGSPNSAAFAMATLDNDSQIEAQIYTGGSWSAVFRAANDAGDKTTRLFDLAYEQASGELLLVYRKSGTSNICYRTHNGTSWSVESSYALNVGTIKWLTLVPRAGTDEMLLIAQGDAGSNHVRAAIWNGSSFGNASVIASGGSSDSKYCHAHGAWESASGDAIVVFNAGSSNPGYRTFVSGTWSAAQSAPSVGSTPRWTRLASHPTSNSILLSALDSAHDVNVNVWNGDSWESNAEVETNIGTTDGRGMDMTWQPNGSAALLVYGESGNTLKYRVWNGSSWSSEASGPQGGNSPIWNVQAVPGLNSGQVFVTWGMDNSQVRTAVWNGSSFSSASAFSPSGTNKEFEVFMVATSAGGGEAQFVINSWTERPRYEP